MDKEYIIDGLAHGFSLIDQDLDNIVPAFMKNHTSATGHLRGKVEARIKAEIEDNNYIIVDSKPVIISALAAIEKADGQVRLIHDLSRPYGTALNDYAEKDPCYMQSVNDALQLIQPGFFMAKVDLEWAYRSVSIKQCEQILTGLQWTFDDGETRYMCDTKLPFGSRKSPAIFNRLTQAVRRMMERRGYNVVAYIDDFLVVGKTFEECIAAYNTLLVLLRQLGFRINWKKVVDPCQELVFLGIHINTISNKLSLDPDKKQKLLDCVESAQTKTRMTKAQLQSLAGKLNWACSVVRWGMARVQSIFQLIRNLSRPRHKAILTAAAKSDLAWWHSILAFGINERQIWVTQPQINIITDACSIGSGAFCLQDGSWLYANWLLDFPALAKQHINVKELAIIVYALCIYAPIYPGHHFNVGTDNMFSMYAINKGTSRNLLGRHLIFVLEWLCRTFSLSVSAYYIPGKMNCVADSISRLHKTEHRENVITMFKDIAPVYFMSELSLLYLSCQGSRALRADWSRK